MFDHRGVVHRLDGVRDIGFRQDRVLAVASDDVASLVHFLVSNSKIAA